MEASAVPALSSGGGVASYSNSAPSPDRTAPQRVLCSTSSRGSTLTSAGTSCIRVRPHPGEHLPAHRSLQDKHAAARRLRDELAIKRPVLVDDLEGTVHAAYGLMPNMSWVLGRGGTILYKAMWTSADRIADFLHHQQGQLGGLAHGFTPSSSNGGTWTQMPSSAVSNAMGQGQSQSSGVLSRSGPSGRVAPVGVDRAVGSSDGLPARFRRLPYDFAGHDCGGQTAADP